MTIITIPVFEPDRVDFTHEGLKCAILRMPETLHLCGYVGLPPSHPFYGFNYSEELCGNSIESLVKVHGGLSYANSALRGVISPATWWFGFDCAHAWDFRPGDSFNQPDAVYRDLTYVITECKSLAEQFAGIVYKGVLA